ncbi:MAG TPA: GH92 family glycosyl hydrolase [Jatrophihabitans sp.]
MSATSAAAATPGSFSTSFEATDPAAVSTTVENGLRHGISASSNRLPGSVIDASTPIQASAENPPGEVATNLADADPSTKWLAFQPTATLTYHLPQAAAITTYALTSANDAPERDPNTFTLEGSDDGTTFTTLDTRTGQTWSGRGVRNTYQVPAGNVAPYSYYRLDITAPASGGLLQLADWDLAVASGSSDPGPMTSATGDGPTHGYNLKQNAGWTGMHAYQYAGKQTIDGDAYETNVVQDNLNIPVGPHSQLSYKVIPFFTASDMNYPSTYVALDLHFTDGTYLSQLHPVDQHGVPLTAAGQGDGKILYADQWNAESSDIGSVAAGKTIDRVLLSYHDPNAKSGTAFGGWVDDVAVTPSAPQVDASTLTNVVDTRRGTNASGSFSRGNNLPISAVPNGFTFLTPVTDSRSNSWEYYYQQANDANNHPTLQGFSVSHEPSPWMGDRNQLSVMPGTSATPSADPSARALAFTHDGEIARPDYYRVNFLNGLTTEMAPTDHGVDMRFTFPSDSGSLLFDTVDRNGSFVIDPSSGTVHGWVDNGSGLSAGRSRMFFSGTFSAKPTSSGTAPNGNPEAQYAAFGTKTVELRLATSFIGLAQAQHNEALELTGQSFDQVHAAATQAWQQRLGVLDVSGETDSQRETLYSNLYRLNLYPNSQFENAGTAAAPDYQYASPTAAQTGAPSDTTTNAAVKHGKVYVNNGFWDTYRTVWPAYSLLYPQVAADLVDGFVQQYRDGGWVARWSSPGYADLMTGTSSDVAFAGAYLRGVPVKDPLTTYEAALKNATVLPTSSGVGRKGLSTSIFKKYTSTTTGESVSWQLEGDINDAGLSQMAGQLANDSSIPAAKQTELRDEAKYFADRAGQYVNLFDPSIGFFQGRKPDGSWNQSKTDYDPESWGGVYTETDGWNFAFHAPQDGQGLADLYGGRAALANKLDTFFATPETAGKPGGYGGVIHEMLEARAVRMGQFGMSNQPSHHIPYMYDYVQQPFKTQALVREVLRRLYAGQEIGQGYPGDEDNGEMSSWYILSSLGLYPLQSGSPNWVIGSPQFPKVVVHRSTGDLTITAANNSATNVYVQSLAVNGRPHPATWVSTKDLAGNANLSFVMGSSPSTWGTHPDDVPPSPTTGSTAPQPYQDATSQGVGTLTAANGQDVSALTDDDSTTQTTFADGVPPLTWKTNGAMQRVEMYTLTSGSAAGDPTGWTLQGSNDGSDWTTVDTRTNETFPWRVQTRPFSVANPRPFRQYRLQFTGSGMTSLAEVELLVKPGASDAHQLTVSPTKDNHTGRTGSPSSGTFATFVGAKNTSAADYTASIGWGDGSTSAGTVTAGQLSSYSVQGTHTYVKPGYYRVTVTVSGPKQSSASGVSGITISQSATGGIVPGFDGVCIADDGVSVDCDGGGYSYSRQALAAAGAPQGKVLTVPNSAQNGASLHFVLPAVAAGSPDNAKGDGQTVPVSLPADATRIAFIGAGTEGFQTASATLKFSDGSTRTVDMNFPDWTLGGGGTPPAPFVSVAATQYRLHNGSQDGAKPYLFAGPAISLPAGKTLTGVVMPTQPGTEKDQGRVHLFSIADDGTPAPALTVTAAPDSSATTGQATTVALGQASGGATGATRTARVQWGDTSVTEDAAVDPSGAISAQHTWTAPGTYPVHVTVSDGQDSATTSKTVTVGNAPAQTAALSSQTLRPGSTVTATGTRFRPGEQVTVLLATPHRVSRMVTADGNGRISTRLTVPAGTASGRYAVVATGARSRRPATVTAHVANVAQQPAASEVLPTLVLSSTTAMPGEQVTASGTGYHRNQSVPVYAVTGTGRTVRVATAHANGDGVFTATFVVPAVAGGIRSVHTANATAAAAAPARSPFRIVHTPHGSR